MERCWEQVKVLISGAKVMCRRMRSGIYRDDIQSKYIEYAEPFKLTWYYEDIQLIAKQC